MIDEKNMPVRGLRDPGGNCIVTSWPRYWTLVTAHLTVQEYEQLKAGASVLVTWDDFVKLASAGLIEEVPNA